MNMLPVQLTSAANTAAGVASKERTSESGDTETAFRDVLQGEMAGHRQADASPSGVKSDKTASKVETKATAESVEAGGEKDEAEQPARLVNPEEITQFLALTSQFMQHSSGAADATATVDAALVPAGAAGQIPAVRLQAEGDAVLVPADAAGQIAAVPSQTEADAALLPAAAAGSASPDSNASGLPVATTVAVSAAQQRSTGSGESPAVTEKTDFAAKFDQARAIQQAAIALPQKGVQPEGSLSLPAASGVPESTDIQQPQAASSIALQQAGIEQSERMTDPAADRIAPRVATQAWDQAVGQKVVWMARNEQQSASLSLNPPELGPLQVVIRVSESMATANFVSAHPEVRQALEASLPRLREMLAEAGIQLGQTHVGADTSGEYGAQAQQQMPKSYPNTVETSYALQPDIPQSARVVRRGLVDTFA